MSLMSIGGSIMHEKMYICNECKEIVSSSQRFNHCRLDHPNITGYMSQVIFKEYESKFIQDTL